MTPQEMIDRASKYGGIISASLETVSITEHPDFHRKHKEWGVVEAHWTEPWYDEVENEWYGPEWIPEDRKDWNPAHDNTSMADHWDYDKGQFKTDCPRGLYGIKSYIRPKMTYAK